MTRIAGFVGLTATILLLVFAYLYQTGRVELLFLNRRVACEVNGAPVPADLFEHRYDAIVTLREPGKEHSYLLSYAGDVDPTGNIGFVSDCHDWVAPRWLLMMIRTTTYPPCTMRPQEQWSLKSAGDRESFVTAGGASITIYRRLRH